VFVASPDGADIRAHPVPFSLVDHAGSNRVRLRLPRLEYWSLIMARLHFSWSLPSRKKILVPTRKKVSLPNERPRGS
jgi:hypothetical protein